MTVLDDGRLFDSYDLEVSVSKARFRWSRWNGRRFQALRSWRVDGPSVALPTLARVLGGEPGEGHLVSNSSAVTVTIEGVESASRALNLSFRLADAPDVGTFTFASSLPWFVDAAARLAPGDRAVLALGDAEGRNGESRSAVPVLLPSG